MDETSVMPPSVRPRIKAESEKLLKHWGTEASDMAKILAFRAQAGLLHEVAPGFWRSVASAIGHRIGLPDSVARGDTLLVL